MRPLGLTDGGGEGTGRKIWHRENGGPQIVTSAKERERERREVSRTKKGEREREREKDWWLCRE